MSAGPPPVRPRTAASPAAGAGRLEVFHQRIVAVAEAMGARLQRAAYSANIKERLDFSSAVFDAEGRLVAQAAHIPVHLGAMPAAVAAARRHLGPRGWRPGDVILANDPYAGGSHLPDLTTVSPVFAASAERGRSTTVSGRTAALPIAFLATRAHHADVGGNAPGSLPVAADLFGEGLVIPPVHLVRGGRIVEDVLRLVCANTRSPDERRADLEAQLGAHYLGARELQSLIGTMGTGAGPGGGAASTQGAVPDEGVAPAGAAKHGDVSPGGPVSPVGAFEAACRELLDYSERRARQVLASLPAGTYHSVDALEGDGWRDEPLMIRLRLTIGGGEMVADFSGTAPQTKGGVNAPLAVTQAAAYYVLACLVDDTPINAGLFAPLLVLAPAGSLLNPRPPAAVAAGNVETSQRLVDVVLAALGKALPERVPAASQGTMNNLVFGLADPAAGRGRTYYETLGGGGGGGPAGPGLGGRQTHMTNTRNTPVEALELAYPVRVEAYRLRQGSGGRGRHVGGEGLERAIRFLAPAEVTLLAERRQAGPPGAAGGGPGAPGADSLIRADGREVKLAAKSTFAVSAGDVVRILTPGGGGWGAPPTGSDTSTADVASGGEAAGAATRPPASSEAETVQPVAGLGHIQDDEQRADPA